MSAEKNIYTHLHLRGNELRGFVFERLESDPDPIDGMIYYNVAKNEFRACISGVWVNIFSIWHVDDDGNITTDKQVIIKNNLIVEEDTGSGGDGEDTVTGIIGVVIDGVTYRNTADGLLDLSDAFDNVSVDLSNYYTKSQVDNLLGKYVTLSTAQTISGAKTFTALLTATGGMRITGDVEIDGNLIVTGDTASGDEGEDTIVGITGVKVNGVTYTDTDGDGIVDLGTISGGSGGTVSGGISSVKLNGVTYTDTNGDGIIDLGTISGGSGGNEGITFEELDDFLTTNKYLQVNNWGVKGQILMANFTGTPIWADPSAIGLLPLAGGTMKGSIDLNSYALLSDGKSLIVGSGKAPSFGNSSAEMRVIAESIQTLIFDLETESIEMASYLKSGLLDFYTSVLISPASNYTYGERIVDDPTYALQVDGNIMASRSTIAKYLLYPRNGSCMWELWSDGQRLCLQKKDTTTGEAVFTPFLTLGTYIFFEGSLEITSASAAQNLTGLTLVNGETSDSISLGFDDSMALMFTDMDGDSYEVVHAGNYSKYITGGVECLPLTGGTIEGDLTLNGSFMFPTWKMYEDSTVFSLASLSENGEYTRMFALTKSGGLSVRGLCCGSTLYSTAELRLANSSGVSFIIVDPNGVLLYQAYNSSAYKILHSGNYHNYISDSGGGSVLPILTYENDVEYMIENGVVSGQIIETSSSISMGFFSQIFPRAYGGPYSDEEISCVVYIRCTSSGKSLHFPTFTTSRVALLNTLGNVANASSLQTLTFNFHMVRLDYRGVDASGYAIWYASI